MAPIRRYLRITRYSVLECRIYLDNPALVDNWFLHSRNPVLPRVIESIRPLVLPKLREENERSKGRGKKTLKGIKDVVVEDDFEVAIFLTEPSTRHSLLIKQKYFIESRQRLGSNSRKLTDSANDHLDDSETGRGSPIVLEEDDEREDATDLQGIPLAPTTAASREVGRDGGRRDKSPRTNDGNTPVLQRDRDSPSEVIDLSEGDNMAKRDSRQQNLPSDTPELVEGSDDKKQLFMSNSQPTSHRSDMNDGQAMMENWIRSTQLDPDET